jgi:hypothetical protein
MLKLELFSGSECPRHDKKNEAVEAEGGQA